MVAKQITFHEFHGTEGYKSRRAEVIRIGDVWGAVFFDDNVQLFSEMYEEKSEYWAEDCAENWVLGIKETPYGIKHQALVNEICSD
jgi:hypothetical protein